jgi:hypothetical protein
VKRGHPVVVENIEVRRGAVERAGRLEVVAQHGEGAAVPHPVEPVAALAQLDFWLS